MKNKFINPSNEFHILRHFKYVSDEYKNSLIWKKYYYFDYEKEDFIIWIISEKNIENALNTIWTKFDKNILWLENPKKVLEFIYKNFSEKKLNFLEKNNLSFQIKYNKSVWKINCLLKNQIGDNSIIKKEFRSKCNWENNIIVNTVSGIKLYSTNSIDIFIQHLEKLDLFFTTAFPYCQIPDNVNFENIVFAI